MMTRPSPQPTSYKVSDDVSWMRLEVCSMAAVGVDHSVLRGASIEKRRVGIPMSRADEAVAPLRKQLRRCNYERDYRSSLFATCLFMQANYERDYRSLQVHLFASLQEGYAVASLPLFMRLFCRILAGPPPHQRNNALRAKIAFEHHVVCQ